MPEQIVLPAKVYDALMMSAAMYGGIGAGDWITSNRTPLCMQGHLEDAFGVSRGCKVSLMLWEELRLGVVQNDGAVTRINRRKGKEGLDICDRVSFEEWCAELNVVRGPDMAHNHGPDEGPGMQCPEHTVGGQIVGECVLTDAR